MNHAKLSASSSSRWIQCPGSANAEYGIIDLPNKYSAEGRLAHELAERILLNRDYSDLEVTTEMVTYVKDYTDYISSIHSGVESRLYIEKRVDYASTAPEGFGTADAIILNSNYFGDELHIIDLKYGQGARIEAYENTQLLLYAIGALNTLEKINIANIEYIHLEIIQPRLNHKAKWTITLPTLKYWEGYLKAKAEEASRHDAPRRPSISACQWCKVQSNCKALYNFTAESNEATNDSSELEKDLSDNMSDEDTKNILDNSKLISSFINSVEERVYNHLLTGGELLGYKLVNGKKIRKLKSNSEEIIVELLGEKAYNKSILGVRDLEKLIDKETLDSLIYFSQNRPLLVKENDKREAIILEELEFDPIEN